MAKRRIRWDPELKAMVLALYPHVKTSAIADALDCAPSTVYHLANMLGVKKTAEFMASISSGRIQNGRTHPGMVRHQFPKGHVPANKGVKGYQAGGRSAETRFKKGNKPVNEMPIGSYRIVTDSGDRQRKTVEIKLTDLPGRNDRRWKPVHRYVWEQHNGPIPAGHVVRFRDGMHTIDPNLITIDRLEMITNADNLRRNSIHARYPEDLKRLIYAKIHLTRQINKRRKKDDGKND